MMTLLLSQSFGLRPRFDLNVGHFEESELKDVDDEVDASE